MAATVVEPSTVTDETSRRPSGLRKTKSRVNSLAHRTTWLRSDFRDAAQGEAPDWFTA